MNMDVKFIAQGLTSERDKPIGHEIINSLEQEEYNSFCAFVAFASTSGIYNIEEQLIRFQKKGGNIRIYLGVDLFGTSKEALLRLIELEIPTYIVYSPNAIVYHPKIYAFEGQHKNFVIVGSSNLTASGLFQNVEASVCLESREGDEEGRELLSDIYDYFNALLSKDSTISQRLTNDILDILVKNKIVLSEKEGRYIKNSIASENRKVISSDNELLKETFKKLKVAKPPKGYKKSLTQKVIIPSSDEREDSIVTFQICDVSKNSMWIETGKMTGASRNILDLSKKGRRDNERKFGSVEFFGVNAEDMDANVFIEIVYNGKIYKDNRLFYTEGNSNWRFQLKGISDDGAKLTDISRPQFGHMGGFQNKILIFEKTQIDNRYNLSIIESDEIEKIKDISTDWAYGGHGAGRAYGII